MKSVWTELSGRKGKPTKQSLEVARQAGLFFDLDYHRSPSSFTPLTTSLLQYLQSTFVFCTTVSICSAFPRFICVNSSIDINHHGPALRYVHPFQSSNGVLSR